MEANFHVSDILQNGLDKRDGVRRETVLA